MHIPPPGGHVDITATGVLTMAATPGATVGFTADAALTASGIAGAATEFTSSGVLQFPTAGAVTDLTADGTLTVDAVPVVDAPMSSIGALTFTAAPHATVAFTGNGQFTMPAGAGATAPFTGSGTVAAAASSFAPSGMTKSGSNYNIPSSATEVPTWTADTSGYPGSTLSGNGLVANGSKTGASLSSSCSITNTQAISVTVTLYLWVNGALVATGAGANIAAFGSGTATVSHTMNIGSGDVVTLRASASVANYCRINTGASSYVRIT
ncbi:hypothetical protein [Nocardia otitidiscaviarum]|uniref:hypothetical protein n=1 Tax=Nocardia otitidiscaviarum TaxID=1823 RepID=UPI0024567E4C|nr:hypothetical protein [Nocardia otitidiscaviarum]